MLVSVGIRRYSSQVVAFELLFRGKRLNELAFGTSGLRGLVKDLTDLEVYINTRGFIEFLRSEDPTVVDALEVFVGGDLRPSTERILRAVHRAVADAGGKFRYFGLIPSPALAAYAFAHQRPSIMVTGSHIPFDRNGLKFNLPHGEVLKRHESPILAHVKEQRRVAYEQAPDTSLFDDNGTFRLGTDLPLPEVDGTAESAYRERYTQFFGNSALKGLRLAVYQHSAVGRDVLVDILRRTGAEVYPVGRSQTFIPIDTEAVDAKLLQEICELADEARSALRGLDAVVSTDGDSDRPLLVVFDADQKAHFVRGDVLGTLASEDLDLDAVAIPVSASDLVDMQLVHLGVSVQRTRIGSPWVIDSMHTMEGVRKAGFEANGGFLLATENVRDGRSLSPLPTRDAVLPLLVVLQHAVAHEQSIYDRIQRLPARHTTAGVIDDVAREAAHKAMAHLQLSGALEAWFRPYPRVRTEEGMPRSATSDEVTVLEGIKARVEKRFGPHGLTSLEYVNWVDGIRMQFAGGDVLHLRPSGNAPQFRVYVTASSLARAEELVDASVAPLGAVSMMLEEAQNPGELLANGPG